MFESSKRPIVVPHAEHARLAGIIASQWGNDEFARPPFSFQSFVTGVTFHDRGYGHLDTLPLGRMADEEWLAVQEASHQMAFRDCEAELVVQFQLLRIANYSPTPEKEAFSARLRSHISTLIARSTYQEEQFLRTDRITQLCDNIAFDFAFEHATTRSVEVFANPHAEE
ncbi:MAG: DUF3891 family protein, partial [Bdellovibrionales bacterium]|nr:DUF3891 family protein [Bdellovibrionales bacterium]